MSSDSCKNVKECAGYSMETIVGLILDPFGIAKTVFVFGCMHGLPGCDREAHCLNWWDMPACHEEYFGDIHTPAYREALRRGHNVRRRR